MSSLTLLFIFVLSAHAATAYECGSGSEASFVAVGKPSMLKIHGHGGTASCHLSLSSGALSGSVEVDETKFTSGIETRDKHMKEKYLETTAFPRAELKVTKANVGPDFGKGMSTLGEIPFSGSLKLHGKERTVEGTFRGAGGKLDAKFPVKLAEFGIVVPKYLGITVADSVDVEAHLELKGK